MGQYYSWVNVDKHERLDSCFWDYSPTLHGRCFTPCEENQAMLSLLATHWRGDVVVFFGDYAKFNESDHPGCRYIRERIDATGWSATDFIYEARDATSELCIAKGSPKNRCNTPDDESLDYYDGSFDVDIKEWRYVVNPARREYIDYQLTPVLFISAKVIQRYDPLPLLLVSAAASPDDPEEIEGRWLGDAVYPTNEDPSTDFSLIADDYVGPLIDWPVLRGVTDVEVRKIMADAGIDLGTENDHDVLAILTEGLKRERS